MSNHIAITPKRYTRATGTHLKSKTTHEARIEELVDPGEIRREIKKDERAREMHNEMTLLKAIYKQHANTELDLAVTPSAARLEWGTSLKLTRQLALSVNPGLGSVLRMLFQGSESVASFPEASKSWGGTASLTQDPDGTKKLVSFREHRAKDNGVYTGIISKFPATKAYHTVRSLTRDEVGNEVYRVTHTTTKLDSRQSRYSQGQRPLLQKREEISYTPEGLLQYNSQMERYADRDVEI